MNVAPWCDKFFFYWCDNWMRLGWDRSQDHNTATWMNDLVVDSKSGKRNGKSSRFVARGNNLCRQQFKRLRCAEANLLN